MNAGGGDDDKGGAYAQGGARFHQVVAKGYCSIGVETGPDGRANCRPGDRGCRSKGGEPQHAGEPSDTFSHLPPIVISEHLTVCHASEGDNIFDYLHDARLDLHHGAGTALPPGAKVVAYAGHFGAFDPAALQ